MKDQYKFKKPLRVAVYARFGTDPQALPEVSVYSGKQNLLTASRANQIDHLVVDSFTHLGRNIVESLDLLRDLNSAGVKVHLLKEGWVV